MKNADLRYEFRLASVRQWEVAEAMGISEMTLVKWLRKELSDEQKQRVRAAISQLAAEKQLRK